MWPLHQPSVSGLAAGRRLGWESFQAAGEPAGHVGSSTVTPPVHPHVGFSTYLGGKRMRMLGVGLGSLSSFQGVKKGKGEMDLSFGKQ